MQTKFNKHTNTFFEAYCVNCGFTHRKPNRLKRLRRTLPADVKMIRETWSCVYGNGEDQTKDRMLFRDLKDLGAVSRPQSREWYIPEDEA